MARRTRGTISKRDKGTWLVRVYIGNVDGKRKYVAKIVGGPKSNAQSKLTEMLYEIDQGSFVEPSSLTVESWAERWLGGKNNLRKTTRMDYESRLRLDVYPLIGRSKLQDVRPHECRALISAMQERGLSKRTQQYTHMIIRQCLDQARADGLIPSNPMDNVERPTVRTEDKVQEIAAFTAEEVKTLLRANEDTKHYALWVTLLTTGLRPSEALALEWQHIDFEKRQVRVKQAISRVGHGEFEIGGLKTESSHRKVPLTAMLADVLKTHRAELMRKQLLLGKRSELVFPNGAFALHDISRIRRAWTKACRQAGVRELRLYDSRHSYATRFLEAGINPKVAAELLGHSSTKMFLDVYTHVTDTQRDGLQEKIQAAVLGA